MPPELNSFDVAVSDGRWRDAPWLLPDGTLPSAEHGGRVLLVLGKGGVGRTTTCAAIAHGAAEEGLRVLIVGLDGRPTLTALTRGTEVTVRMVSAGTALEDYLLDQGFGGFAKRLATSGVIEVVGAAAPGIHDLVVLGKVKQFANEGRWDVIVVDAPAAGHATSMLTSVDGLLDIVEGGPIREQALAVRSLLLDHDRSAAVLVTLAETTPVSESLELAAVTRESVGVAIAAGVVSAVEPVRHLPSPDAVHGVRGAPALRTLLERAAVDAEVATASIDRCVLGLSAPVALLPRLPVAGLDVASSTLLGRLLAAGGVR